MHIKYIKLTKHLLFYCKRIKDNPNTFYECGKLSELELEDLWNLALTLNKLVRLQNQDYSVKEALSDFRNICNISKEYSLRLGFDLERFTRTYLWEYFALIGQYDELCKKCNDKNILKIKNDLKQSEEYHLAKILRNYVTHAGMISHHIVMNTNKVSVFVEKDILLRRLINLNFDKDKNDIKLLSQIKQSHLDVGKIVERSYDKLADLQYNILKFFVEINKENLERVCKYYKSINPQEYDGNYWIMFSSNLLVFGEQQVVVYWQSYLELMNL